eukprot:TRINITY_DN37898_c0_g1_i1.p1 TRINITY_DN37898_c0_g1~~TRINITY_DN37898_c0_g1_i1.p1  ORF type:complete len:352 (-),score=61.76 TRINITY_DN37898_c0_g1_i1:9-1064(-)
MASPMRCAAALALAAAAVSASVAGTAAATATAPPEGGKDVRGYRARLSFAERLLRREGRTRARRSRRAVSLVPDTDGVFHHPPGDLLCNNCKNVYYQMGVDGVTAWALVLKLAQNQFCFNSSAWTTKGAINGDKMLNTVSPKPGEYDAKSIAFHRLKRVSALKFERNHGGPAVTVHFEGKDTPQQLFTGESGVLMKAYPRFDKWIKVFDPEATHQTKPMFMRNGVMVMDPLPPCRPGNYELEGCGEQCVFCFYAKKTNKDTFGWIREPPCTEAEGCGYCGEGPGPDYSIGIGHNVASCFGDVTVCSVNLNRTKVNPTSILVWAKVGATDLQELAREMDRKPVDMGTMAAPR